MAEYVIVNPSTDPDEVLGQVTVDDDSGVALVHDLVGSPGVIHFDTLEEVRRILSWMRPEYEIREA